MCSKPNGYATEHDAQVALVSAIIAKNRGKNQRRERRHYFCEGCKRWVLTSMTLAEYESSRLTQTTCDTVGETKERHEGTDVRPGDAGGVDPAASGQSERG